eukprot:4151710-Lingulodinium_polyedra.AAC.1
MREARARRGAVAEPRNNRAFATRVGREFRGAFAGPGAQCFGARPVPWAFHGPPGRLRAPAKQRLENAWR